MGDLRDGILEALLAHDPLHEARDPEALEPYGFEADELATVLAGTGADAETCAVATWAVLGGGAFGAVESCRALGAAIAELLAAQAEGDDDAGWEGDEDDDLDDDGDEDDDLEDDGELSDPVATAVLMSLIACDPYALGRREGAVDWHAAYAALALDLVSRLRAADGAGAAVVLDLVREGARAQPSCPDDEELEGRLHRLDRDVAEIARAAEYLRGADVDETDLDPDSDDPLGAGIRAILDRDDPAPGAVDGDYGNIAAGVAECLREAEAADASTCARVVWTELRRWGDPVGVGEIASVEDVGEQLADLLSLYRDALRVRPELVATLTPDVPEDPLVRAVQRILEEIDPLSADEEEAEDYQRQAAHAAAILRGGAADALQCQAIVWRVVVRWFGAFAAGPLSVYRDAGVEVYRAVRDHAV